MGTQQFEMLRCLKVTLQTSPISHKAKHFICWSTLDLADDLKSPNNLFHLAQNSNSLWNVVRLESGKVLSSSNGYFRSGTLAVCLLHTWKRMLLKKTFEFCQHRNSLRQKFRWTLHISHCPLSISVIAVCRFRVHIGCNSDAIGENALPPEPQCACES